MTTIGVAIAVPEPWGPELQAYRTALDAGFFNPFPRRAIRFLPLHLRHLPGDRQSDEQKGGADRGIERDVGGSATIVQAGNRLGLVHARGPGDEPFAMAPVDMIAERAGDEGEADAD